MLRANDATGVACMSVACSSTITVAAMNEGISYKQHRMFSFCHNNNYYQSLFCIIQDNFKRKFTNINNIKSAICFSQTNSPNITLPNKLSCTVNILCKTSLLIIYKLISLQVFLFLPLILLVPLPDVQYDTLPQAQRLLLMTLIWLK